MASSSPSSIVPGIGVVRRDDFPSDFKFGCSTSAIQTEGAGNEGGRGPSTWDSFIQAPGDAGKNNIAVDSYRRYKEDVQLLKNTGLNTYRFSISWSRILPDGTIGGGINQAGIDFYNNFINELLKYGITPFVTLFHFDLPQNLQDKYSGFLSPQIVEDFKAYANLCFKTFGDRVKFWTTINEPQTYGEFGYKVGMKNNPNPKPATDPYLATHHIILCHAQAAKLYQQQYQPSQKGQIGICLVIQWFKPRTEDREDIAAAERAVDFLVGWMLGPLVFGDYPFAMKSLVGNALPTFSEDEKSLVKNSFDFIGCNYYTSRYAFALPYNPNLKPTNPNQFQFVTVTANNLLGQPIGAPAPGNNQINVYPQGLKEALLYIKKHYKDPILYISENGYPEKRDDSIALEIALQDDARINHILVHLNAVKEAMKEGAKVKGYIMWALMDCLEFGSGYQVRFGLNYTDYLNNLTRIPKKSAKWFLSWGNEHGPKPASPPRAALSSLRPTFRTPNGFPHLTHSTSRWTMHTAHISSFRPNKQALSFCLPLSPQPRPIFAAHSCLIPNGCFL